MRLLRRRPRPPAEEAPSNDSTSLSRFCRETRSQLPALTAGDLSGWPLHVVRAHLKRCADCAGEQLRQEQLSSALASIKDSPPTPPPGLLDDLLARADGRGVRARAAVPARGAISGARPGLSVAFLTVGAAASTGIGYGVYRGIKAIRGRGNG
ncbi:MAG: zf-HC2 domain-containing protein [Frankiaceae bacterium]|nr:zf-HC2 domain-containing protein [Frankiaceae bacterium]MBV9871302.1 zf-HC2 domain-containing protein [Frankiaceae bacterium]